MTLRHDGLTSAANSNTIAAIFATERDARSALKALHKAGFKQTWLGKTREADAQTGEPTVELDGLARFFSAGAERRPLHRALIERGITESQAQSIEREIAVGTVVVTVYGEDNPQRAADVLAEERGDVIDSGTNVPQAVANASLDPRTGVERAPTERGDSHDDDDDDLAAYESEEFYIMAPRERSAI